MEIYVGMSASACLLSNVNPLPLLPVSWNSIPWITERLFRWLEWEPASNPPQLHTLYWAPPSIHLPVTHACVHTHAHKSGTGREAGQLMEQHKRTLISLVPLLVTCLSVRMSKMNGWRWTGMRCIFHWLLCVENLICPLLVPSIMCTNSCLSSFIQVPWMHFTHFPQILSNLVEPSFTSYCGRSVWLFYLRWLG